MSFHRFKFAREPQRANPVPIAPRLASTGSESHHSATAHNRAQQRPRDSKEDHDSPRHGAKRYDTVHLQGVGILTQRVVHIQTATHKPINKLHLGTNVADLIGQTLISGPICDEMMVVRRRSQETPRRGLNRPWLPEIVTSNYHCRLQTTMR